MDNEVVHKPENLERCVEHVMAQGYTESEAYAICNAALNRAGGPPARLVLDFTDGKDAEQIIRKAYAAETKATKEGDIESYVSTEAIDRVGDSIPVKAWDLDNFIKTASPVLAFHEYGLWGGQVPVVGNAVKIEKQRKGLYSVTRFHQKTQLSRDLAVLYRDGHMNAFSVGFKSLLPPDIRKDDEGRFQGYLFNKVELLEYSVVAVPANPEAVVRAFRNKTISAQTASFIAGHSPMGGNTGSGGDDLVRAALTQEFERRAIVDAFKGARR